MADDHHDGGEEGRVTSPMQDFGMSEVTIGLVVLAVGLAVAYVLPLIA